MKPPRDGTTCECPSCTHRRGVGVWLHRIQQITKWIWRFAIAGLLAAGIAGITVSSIWLSVALVAGGLIGFILVGIDFILGHPKLMRRLTELYPEPPIYVPHVQKARQMDLAERQSAHIQTFDLKPSRGFMAASLHPRAAGTDPVNRAMTLSAILGINATLWSIACIMKDRPAEGLIRYQTFLHRSMEALASEDLAPEDVPLTEELMEAIFRSFLRQLRADARRMGAGGNRVGEGEGDPR